MTSPGRGFCITKEFKQPKLPAVFFRYYQLGELRPLTPFPVNFRMPYPIPGMVSESQRPPLGRPEVVDLLLSPDEKPDNVDPSKVEKTDEMSVDGKLDVLLPPMLVDKAQDSCNVNQSTAGASEQPILRPSGNKHEITNAIASASETGGEQQLVLKTSESETLKNSSVNIANSGTIRSLDDSSKNLTSRRPNILTLSNFGVQNTVDHCRNKTESSNEDFQFSSTSDTGSVRQQSCENVGGEVTTTEVCEDATCSAV